MSARVGLGPRPCVKVFLRRRLGHCYSTLPGREESKSSAGPAGSEDPQYLQIQQPVAGRTRLSQLTLRPTEPPVLINVNAFKRKGDWAALRQALASFTEVRKGVIRGFLPNGYPNSVTPNYASHIKWSFVASVTGTVTGVLSTQSLLYAIGLGAGAIPVAAALNWVIKDGLGQLGGVLYAHFIGDRFDSDPKKLRFEAAVSMQAATFLELITPIFPAWFLPIASISNIGKNVSWLAMSSTRAHMHKTFALRDNLGDITGKAGSQSTAGAVLGTGLGVLASSYVGTSVVMSLALFAPISALNLFAVYKSSKVVISTTINVQRAEVVMESLAEYALNNDSDALPNALTPAEVSQKERFVFPWSRDCKVMIDPPLSKLIRLVKNEVLLRSFSPALSKCGRYFLVPLNQGHKRNGENVALLFATNISPEDELRGFWHATLFRMGCTTKKWDCNEKGIEQSRIMADNRWREVQEALQTAGWGDGVFIKGKRGIRVRQSQEDES